MFRLLAHDGWLIRSRQFARFGYVDRVTAFWGMTTGIIGKLQIWLFIKIQIVEVVPS